MATTLFSLTKSGGIAISDNGMVSDLLNIDLIGPWLRILDLRIALNGLMWWTAPAPSNEVP